MKIFALRAVEEDYTIQEYTRSIYEDKMSAEYSITATEHVQLKQLHVLQRGRLGDREFILSICKLVQKSDNSWEEAVLESAFRLLYILPHRRGEERRENGHCMRGFWLCWLLCGGIMK